MKLCNVAAVRSGLVLSRKEARGTFRIRYPLLNLRCIKPEGYIDMDQIDIFDAADSLSPEYLSQVGDVVIRLTAPYTAVLIDECTANMVISSNFVVIRVKRHEILPGYLFWLLNTQEVKRGIYENATSNMLGAVKAKYFSEFEIDPLPIADQERIISLNSLALREKQLLLQLVEEKEKFYTMAVDKIHKEMKRGNENDDP